MSGVLQITEQWKVLRRDVGNLISQLDGSFAKLEAEEKRMEHKRDESYIQGAEDMRKAMSAITVVNGGMSAQDLEEFFGVHHYGYILIENSAKDIIDKVNRWKKEKEKLKETEFKVGDEVEVSEYGVGSCNKYIVIKANSDSNVLWLLDLRTFLRIWIYKDDSSLKKTGRHFDTIDIPEGGATI